MFNDTMIQLQINRTRHQEIEKNAERKRQNRNRSIQQREKLGK